MRKLFFFLWREVRDMFATGSGKDVCEDVCMGWCGRIVSGIYL